MPVSTRRAYDRPDSADGYRVLVDGLWPRGLSRDRLEIDEWMKQIAPSAELRKWYGHDPRKFAEFRRRYIAELQESDRRKLLQRLIDLARKQTVTLVYGTRAAPLSNAAVLEEAIRNRLDKAGKAA